MSGHTRRADCDEGRFLLLAAAPELADALEGLVRDAPLKCAYCGLQSNLAVPRHSPNCPLLAARAALAKAGREVGR